MKKKGYLNQTQTQQNCPLKISNLLTTILAVLLLHTSFHLSAQLNDSCSGICDNNIINEKFESPVIPASTYGFKNENQVPGWQTTATNGIIEIWSSGFQGVPAYEGNQFVELNATQVSGLFQELCLIEGTRIEWSVAHRGRSGVDVASVKIGGSLETAEVQLLMTDGRTAWGTYEGTYTVPVNQERTFILFEAVSATGGNASGNFIDDISINILQAPQCVDTDADGVYDFMDDYPENEKWAFDNFYPAENNNAYLAYEDQWPYTADYDFNDTVIEYNLNTIYNANNEVAAIAINIVKVSVGGSYLNSLAFKINGLESSNIASISGQQFFEGLFNTTDGIENGQIDTVVPIFDNDHKMQTRTQQVLIEFISPISPNSLDAAPFEPFLVINQNRERELHLPGNTPTQLGNATPNVTGVNEDTDGNYLTENGLPWALNIAGSFAQPLEKTPINEAYLNFVNWCTSGGTENKDWYKDNPGNRAAAKFKP